MLHILTPDRFATAAPGRDGLAPDNLAMDAASVLAMDAPSIEDLRRNDALDVTEEYEFVLGRRQIASLAFVVLVLIAVFAGMAYVAGRAAVERVAIGAPQSAPAIVASTGHAASEAPPVIQAGISATLSQALLTPAPAAIPQASVTGRPLFAEPVSGSLYMQIGAVDRGVAALMAEGLRTHGLAAFVGPGPSEKIFRVMVGPLPNMTAFTQTREMLSQIGIGPVAGFQKQ